MVPRSGRPLCEHVGGALGSLRWSPQQAPDRANPLLAPHESAADDLHLERAGADGGDRTRSEPRPDQPFHHALLDIAQQALAENKFSGAQREKIAHHAKARNFNHLSHELGVKVIHCSERDTQITDRPKQVNEFVNTWSVEGFREEGTTTAEMGWGTHERELPALAYEHAEGPKSQICLARMGINTFVATWVPPNHDILGMIVRHGEAFTITEKLTVWEDGNAIYRPTVHYAYCPCDSAIASLHELRGYDYRLQPKIRIMTDEIISGADILGALVMGHPYQSWWCGSDLDIEESRRLVPHQNATTMQVAIAVVAACMWMVENPQRGLCVPDDLPHDYVLEVSMPYLGRFVSVASDWNPLKHYSNFFSGYDKPQLDMSDVWQFKNFLMKWEFPRLCRGG